MKVRATYRLVFEVTRETEVDDDEYAALREHERIRDRDASSERVMPLLLERNLYGEGAEVFRDWRMDKPLPSDFEFQYVEVMEAALVAEGNEREETS